MKQKTIFLFFFGIWLIDFVTTLFILQNPLLMEGNPISRFFINLGINGWISWLMLCAVTFYLFSFIVIKASVYCEKKIKGSGFMLCYIPTVIYVGIEAWIILGNFILFFSAS